MYLALKKVMTMLPVSSATRTREMVMPRRTYCGALLATTRALTPQVSQAGRAAISQGDDRSITGAREIVEQIPNGKDVQLLVERGSLGTHAGQKLYVGIQRRFHAAPH